MPATGEYRRLKLSVSIVTICLSVLTMVAASQSAKGRLSISDIKQIPGQLVAEAENPSPETAMKIKGYQVERVPLPQPQTVRIEGKRMTVRQAWKVTVHFDEPLTVRSQAFSLAIDGHWCGFLSESADLRSAEAICFNSELVREGAAIGVTYRGIAIEQPSDTDQVVNPLAEFEPEGGEPIHYSSVKLHLKGR